ncbi:MAG: translation elongation factor-like protein [Methanobacteriota archaeon]|nr:MAG: translation elongation factor-like protein [Euryarchaeota archaeon]
MEEKEKIGVVFKYFAKPEVAAISIESGTLTVGDRILIQGATTDFEQTVDSMEIDNQKVESAGAGQSIGIKVKDRVRPNDIVYKVV